MQGGVFGIGFNANTERNLVRRNVITGATLAGIWFNGPGERNTARDNLITANQGEGIRLEEDLHRIQGNVVLDNAAGGVEVCGADNVIARNRAFNNEAFDFCIVAASGNRLRGNEGTVFDLACPVPPQCDNLAPKTGDPGDAE